MRSLQAEESPARDRLLARFARELKARPFLSHPLMPGGDLQSIVASQLPRKFPWGWKTSREDYVELADGTRVRAICVFQQDHGQDVEQSRSRAMNREQGECVTAVPSPTLVALHGMAGSSDSIYMQALSHKAYREGWNAILLNLYDMNLGSRKPTIFHSGASSTVREVLRQLIRQYDVRELYVVGVSMSGNILLKMLGESPGDVPPEMPAAAVISPLSDMTISWQILESRRNAFYRLHFIKGLKEIVQRRARYLAPYVDIDALMQIKTIREFDGLFTAPLGGFRDAFDYYEKASAAPVMKDIQLPTLIIHSKDDPFLPWEPFVRPEMASNPSLLIQLCERGGHVGFVERDRIDIDRCWAENRVIDFFRSLAIQRKGSPI